MIAKITLRELATLINKCLRSGEVGDEFSFGEMECEGEIIGYHTCTKISEREVAVRYMGGVCFGLITDTFVSEEDMAMYCESACQYGGKCSDVYIEID